MKIIKHEVKTYADGKHIRTQLFDTKEIAMKAVSDSSMYKKEYSREVEIELYCDYCERELTTEDDYIKKDDDTRYCSGCYEEQSTTYYVVGGEVVGSEDDIDEYSSLFPEIGRYQNENLPHRNASGL